MPSITNGNIVCNFSVGAKDSSGQFTISATFTNTHATSTAFSVRLSCSLTNGSPWSRIDVGTLGPGASVSGSTTISSGNTSGQSVYCYLIYGSSSSGPGGAYDVPAYNPPSPPTPTYYDHKLTYDANGGIGAPTEQKITNTSANSFSAKISNIQPTKDGSTFIGWASSNISEEAEYSPNTTYTFNTANKKLYAVWRAEPKNLTINKYGDGTIRINGETPRGQYNKGETLLVSVTPKNNVNHYYIDRISRITNGIETIVTNDDTIRTYEFSFVMTENTILEVVFALRTYHQLSVESVYQVSGQGSYLYLDTPTLLVNLGGNLVVFDGWYEDGNKLSDANPYTFTMPNRDVYLTLETGGEIFNDQNVRQFALQNGQGEIYKLTNRNSKLFLNQPKGLGFKKSIVTNRLGNAEIVTDESYDMPMVNGELLFYNNTNGGNYEDYYQFVRFISKKPITLWYRIPTNNINNTFHIPVEVMTIEKSESNQYDCLSVPINFYGLNFWQITQTIAENNGHDIELYSDSDYNVGVHLIVSLEQSNPFNNPKILFKQNDEIYGAIAIYKDDLTKLEIDTRDKKQMLTLWQGDSIIPNPFAYIDFSFAGGNKDFPFPKLQQGFTKIVFNYDEETESNKIYIAEFDKEYVSV